MQLKTVYKYLNLYLSYLLRHWAHHYVKTKNYIFRLKMMHLYVPILCHTRKLFLHLWVPCLLLFMYYLFKFILQTHMVQSTEYICLRGTNYMGKSTYWPMSFYLIQNMKETSLSFKKTHTLRITTKKKSFNCGKLYINTSDTVCVCVCVCLYMCLYMSVCVSVTHLLRNNCQGIGSDQQRVGLESHNRATNIRGEAVCV